MSLIRNLAQHIRKVIKTENHIVGLKTILVNKRRCRKLEDKNNDVFSCVMI